MSEPAMFTVVNRGEAAAVVQAKPRQGGREAIHSGHFMVSQFEAEEQDDEYELAVPIPEVTEIKEEFSGGTICSEQQVVSKQPILLHQPVAIDTSLAKLFQCMSIAYRQKLTSPKWNRFRGIRLRWKDKIRLNNVIWRCWHMQFIKKINTLICQFASPLDVDTHNKPEAIVLEGKYWKRKLAAVTAEYKKWRMYYRNNALGHSKDAMDTLSDLDSFNWNSQSSDGMHMMVDEDYLGLMSDTLFSTITNQPFVFPDSREIAKAGLADFIQPSLGPLQPNLDDYMDTFEPLQEFISGKLPTVPEENNGSDALFKQQQEAWCYTDLDLLTSNQNIQMQAQILSQYEPISSHPIAAIQDTRQCQQQPQQIGGYGDHAMMLQNMGVGSFVPHPPPPPPPAYQPPPPPPPPLLGKRSIKLKNISPPNVKPGREVYIKASSENLYSYTTTTAADLSSLDSRLQTPKHQDMPENPASSSRTSGYKFAMIAPAVTPPNLKFTSQPSVSTYKMLPHRTPPAISTQTSLSMLQVNNAIETKLQKESNKTEGRIRNVHRGVRQRSISTSREPVVNKRPPLLTAISDPSLVTPSSSVLTQLLTNSSTSSMFIPAASSSEQKLNVARVKEENSSTSMPLLPQPQPPPTSIIVATPVGLTSSSSSSLSDPLFVASIRASNSSSPASSQQSMGSCPTSPQGSSGLGGSPTRESHSRRSGHLHAEQKRRYNIKNGFDMIQSLIPHLQQNPNAKLSKAAMLQKGAEYIRQLRIERSQLKEEMDSLRQQIESLNTSISNDQSLLPATGAPVSRRRNSKMQEMFDEYVRKRTMEDWKFWIFSLLFRPLLSSFNNFVSTSSIDDLYRSTLLWVEQHCTLVDLRPMILNSLRYLCTKTDILSEPEKLPDEARHAVLSPPGGGGGGGSRRPPLQQL